MDKDFKSAVLEAKENIREYSIKLIVEDLKVGAWDEYKLRGCCPFHNEDTPSFVWNDKNLSFHCFGCNKTYDIINHYISFYRMTSKQAIDKVMGMAEVEYIPQRQTQEPEKEIYKYPKRTNDEAKFENVVNYWKERGISEETLSFFDVTSNKYGNTLFNYYDEYDVLTFVKARHSEEKPKGEKIIGISPKEDRSKNLAGAGKKPVLFGMNKVSPSGTLHITEGEADSLSLIESGITNVVSVPFGSNNYGWIEYNYPWLSRFSKIIVWMDNDDAGNKARREIISRLGFHRCRYIEIPKTIIVNEKEIQVKDINDVLAKIGKEKLIELSLRETEMPIEGIINLEDAEDFDPENWDGLKTGIASIDDEIINKFYFGTVGTVTGTPGSGKSTLVDQLFIVEAVNQGYGVTIFSGEMSPSILRGWVEIAMAGREHVKMKPNSKFIRVIDKQARQKIIDWYKGKIHILKDDDNSLDTILKRAEQTVMVNGDKVIILDNLATMGLGETGESNTFVKQREMMNKLKSFASKYNVLIILVVHPRKPQGGLSAEGVGGYEMSGSADIYNLCHYNLSVRRYTSKEKEGVRDSRNPDKWKVKPVKYDTSVQFYKNRLMGALGKVDLYFDYTYRFYQHPHELWKRYGWDDNTMPIPDYDPNPHVAGEEYFEENDD